MKREVIINNSKLNSLKFRVLTSGIDTSQYLRNPVLLWMHRRPTKEDGSILPIGRIDNLRVEGDNLIGTPVFDESDEFAQKIKAKWEAGFLRMASAGLDPVETSVDPLLLVEGQRRATVTRSKLIEVSIVDIGANDDALVLYRDGQRVCLSSDMDLSIVPETGLHTDLDKQTNEQTNEMKTIALKLGLPETATENEILTKIGSLQLTAQSAEALQRELDRERESAIEAEVLGAITLKRITADKKEHFLSLGKTAGLESLRATLEMMQPSAKPTDVIVPGCLGVASGPEGYKKLSDVPVEKRIELRQADPANYKALYRAEYGVECVIE
jgi:hypothetical protein